jgi:hypothetical protein
VIVIFNPSTGFSLLAKESAEYGISVCTESEMGAPGIRYASTTGFGMVCSNPFSRLEQEKLMIAKKIYKVIFFMIYLI